MPRASRAVIAQQHPRPPTTSHPTKETANAGVAAILNRLHLRHRIAVQRSSLFSYCLPHQQSQSLWHRTLLHFACWSTEAFCQLFCRVILSGDSVSGVFDAWRTRCARSQK